MKRSNKLIIVLLSLIAIYLIFRLFTVDDYNRSDYILLMLLIAGGMVNSIIIFLKKKRWRIEDELIIDLL